MTSARNSDVGGGYEHHRGLADFAPYVMWLDGRSHGVPFADLPSEYLDFSDDQPHNSQWVMPDRLNDAARMSLGLPVRPGTVYFSP